MLDLNYIYSFISPSSFHLNSIRFFSKLTTTIKQSGPWDINPVRNTVHPLLVETCLDRFVYVFSKAMEGRFKATMSPACFPRHIERLDRSTYLIYKNFVF